MEGNAGGFLPLCLLKCYHYTFFEPKSHAFPRQFEHEAGGRAANQSPPRLHPSIPLLPTSRPSHPLRPTCSGRRLSISGSWQHELSCTLKRIFFPCSRIISPPHPKIVATTFVLDLLRLRRRESRCCGTLRTIHGVNGQIEERESERDRKQVPLQQKKGPVFISVLARDSQRNATWKLGLSSRPLVVVTV